MRPQPPGRLPSGITVPDHEGTTLDFWDLTKLLVRYWRVALPVLLATLVLTVLTLVHVKPYYVSTAYVQLVAPIPVARQAGESRPIPRNPWLTQGLSTLGNAALVTVQDLTYAHRLKAEGYADKYTVELGGSNPLVVFAVTGKSRTQARDTANVIVAGYEASLANLQRSYGVAPEDMITGHRLDTGSNITVSSGRVKRDVILVIGLGLMMAAAASVGADMFARRRTRKEAEAQARLILAATPGPSVSVGEPAPEAPRISNATQGPRVAISAAMASASARVPVANRANPPDTGQSADPAAARTAGSSTRAEPPSSSPMERAPADSEGSAETVVIPKIMYANDK